MKQTDIIHALISSLLSLGILYFFHHLPFNQIFIDPFAEAIKNHDITDVAISRFRNHKDPALYDDRVVVINTGITDRSKVAQTIKYLGSRDVGAIGLDLVFDTFYQHKADTLLASAFKSAPNLVLGYSFMESNGKYYSMPDLVSDPFFCKGTSQGYVNLATNDGFTVRAFEPFHAINGKNEKSFAVALVEKIDSTVENDLMERNHTKEWINFRRKQPGTANEIFPVNKDKVTQYSLIQIDQLLKDTASYSKQFWLNKVVLLGFCGENEKSLSMKDRYFTPLNEQYSGKSYPDMHGVVIHANVISMLLDRKFDMISEVPEIWIYLFSFLIFFINFFVFKRLLKKRLFFLVPLVRVIQILQFILLFSICIYLLVHFNIKLGFITIITAVILSFELFEFYEHKLEKRINPWVNQLKERINHLYYVLNFRKTIQKDEENN
ncbi:MAG: CHASE2 domain-containing protein [Saprospiraceae bacterium]|nr:CHASE2 domain-containing protein [Saprospiraceae bacterium]